MIRDIGQEVGSNHEHELPNFLAESVHRRMLTLYNQVFPEVDVSKFNLSRPRIVLTDERPHDFHEASLAIPGTAIVEMATIAVSSYARLGLSKPKRSRDMVNYFENLLNDQIMDIWTNFYQLCSLGAESAESNTHETMSTLYEWMLSGDSTRLSEMYERGRNKLNASSSRPDFSHVAQMSLDDVGMTLNPHFSAAYISSNHTIYANPFLFRLSYIGNQVKITRDRILSALDSDSGYTDVITPLEVSRTTFPHEYLHAYTNFDVLLRL